MIKILLQSILAVAALLLLMAAAITISYGIDDLAMMAVFSTDEPYAVEKIAQNLQENRLDPYGFYNYGYIYHSVIFYLARVFQALDYAVDMRFLAALARAVSFAAYVLLMLVMYRMMKLATNDALFASCFAVLLASTPNLYFWAQYVHPDLLQACLLLLAMYVACRYQRVSGAFAAAAIAGLAFATKYSGIFMFPFLPLPSFFAVIHDRIAAQQRLTWRDAGRFLLALAGMTALFLGVWLVTNPTVIANFHEVVTDIRFESTHVSIGTSAAEPANPFLWFPVIYREFGLSGSVIVAVGLALLAWYLFQHRRQPRALLATPLHRALLTLLPYSAFVFLHLFFFVRARTPRYLFHLLPYVIVLSGAGIALFAQSRKRAERWNLFVACGLTVAILPMTVATIQFMKASSQKYDHPYLQASAWIEQHFPPETSILADVY